VGVVVCEGRFQKQTLGGTPREAGPPHFNNYKGSWPDIASDLGKKCPGTQYRGLQV